MCSDNLLDMDPQFYSNLSKTSYKCGFTQNCKTSNVIYLISCKHSECCMQYVGKTKCAINRRLSMHRANILFGTEGPAMLHHFTKVHRPSDMIIKAIEICNSSNINDREKYWIAELNVVFPYGLNDRINYHGIRDAYEYILNNSSTNLAIYELFNVIKSKRTGKGGKYRRNINNSAEANHVFSSQEFMEMFRFIEDRNIFINFVRNKVMHLNNVDTKSLFLHLSLAINKHDVTFKEYSLNIYNAYLPYLVRDIAFAKIKRSSVAKVPKHYLVINYCNKYMDSIQLNNILKDKSISNLFPDNNDMMKIPMVSFKYSSTIRSKITNYKVVVNEGITPDSCACGMESREYIHDYSGHVFTGNLDIKKNKELLLLLKKGLNFREVPAPNKNDIIKSITSGIDSYIYKIAKLVGKSVECFKSWKIEILSMVNNKLCNLNPYKYNNVLSKKGNIDDLKRYQSKWVFIPTDKAGNNITIVCKKYYMEVLDEEIINSGNFDEQQQSYEDVINKQVNFLNKFKILSKEKLPYLYWTAKLHKQPFKHRFITAGKGCCIQPLSIILGCCLKTILRCIRNYSKFVAKKSGFNKCFIIDNRDPVISCMVSSNQHNLVESVSTFDFQTLYTSIPQNKLKSIIKTLITSTFSSSYKNYITISKNKAYMTVNKSKTGISLNAAELTECIEFVIDNSFIMYKKKIYRQKLGIPMGTNCAPYLANLFLYAYEEAYISNMIQKGESSLVKSLNSIYRYQDDCIVFNDSGVFNKVYEHIYTVEMKLEKTNNGDTCAFLDLCIAIVNNKFQYNSYDKRTYFDFEIINYPDLAGNIPRNPSYGVLVSQLVRFCDINSSIDKFTDVLKLIEKLIKQNFDISIMKHKYNKFCLNYMNTWSKYGIDISDKLSVITTD